MESEGEEVVLMWCGGDFILFGDFLGFVVDLGSCWVSCFKLMSCGGWLKLREVEWLVFCESVCWGYDVLGGVDVVL